MQTSHPRFMTVLTVLVALLALPAIAQDLEHEFTIDSGALVITNLVGAMTIEPASGDQYEVHVAIRGDDAEPGLVDVVLDEGRTAHLDIRFPIEDHRSYVYPELGRGSTTVWQPGDESGSWWDRLWHSMGGDKVTIRGDGRGLEVWADVTVRVPQGTESKFYLAAGNLSADGIDAELWLDTNSGEIDVDRHRGKLVCDTGSGAVKVRDVRGDVLVDTGSGSVKVEDHRGGPLKVDTGSGAVRIDGSDTDDLYVDTGSGAVTARGIRTDKARIDTGSGAVELLLDRMGTGRFIIDTGSGSVHLEMPADASAMVHVDTGSGGIRAKHSAAEILHKDRGELKLRVGGGDAKVIIDTGSGGVTVAER